MHPLGTFPFHLPVLRFYPLISHSKEQNEADIYGRKEILCQIDRQQSKTVEGTGNTVFASYHSYSDFGHRIIVSE